MLDASYNLIWLKGVLLLNYYITCTFYNGHNGIKHFGIKLDTDSRWSQFIITLCKITNGMTI